MKKLTLEDFQKRLDEIHPKENLKALEYISGRQPAKVVCESCGTEYIKNGEYFLDKRKASICKKCIPTRPNTLKQVWQPPEGYELVGEYRGMQNKALVKHISCGFIWEVKPNNMEYGKGCPKCNRKVSKGEQKIAHWLETNNIKYVSQLPIDIQEHHLTIDFYLPQYNLYIEYNGEQHYIPVKHFGGQSKLDKQIEYDNLKKDYLKENLLVIPYTEFNNIESILLSSTTSRKTQAISV